MTQERMNLTQVVQQATVSLSFYTIKAFLKIKRLRTYLSDLETLKLLLLSLEPIRKDNVPGLQADKHALP